MEDCHSYKTAKFFKMLRRGLGLPVSPVTPFPSFFLMFEALVSMTTKGKSGRHEHAADPHVFLSRASA